MNKYLQMIISVAIPLLIGAISGFITVSSIATWYTTLVKPVFNPPNWVFGPVWSVVYVLIGISFYLVWRKGFGVEKTKLKIVYFLQLLLNFAWSISFFFLENPLLGLINILILWGIILYNIILFYKVDKRAGIILIPYILWVSFATVLNIAIYILN